MKQNTIYNLSISSGKMVGGSVVFYFITLSAITTILTTTTITITL